MRQFARAVGRLFLPRPVFPTSDCSYSTCQSRLSVRIPSYTNPIAAVGVTRFHTSPSQSSIQLTSERYPDLKRGQFSSLTDQDIAHFKEILPGSERVLTTSSELASYNEDWMKSCRGIRKEI